MRAGGGGRPPGRGAQKRDDLLSRPRDTTQNMWLELRRLANGGGYISIGRLRGEGGRQIANKEEIGVPNGIRTQLPKKAFCRTLPDIAG